MCDLKFLKYFLIHESYKRVVLIIRNTKWMKNIIDFAHNHKDWKKNHHHCNNRFFNFYIFFFLLLSFLRNQTALRLNDNHVFRGARTNLWRKRKQHTLVVVNRYVSIVFLLLFWFCIIMVCVWYTSIGASLSSFLCASSSFIVFTFSRLSYITGNGVL